tara:strand:+ start:502 stop:858 length:357 start_codon:yes stop_codon:yes gene_type:complete
MSSDDSELERMRAARRAEIQNQIEARADEQMRSEEQDAAAKQEASDLSDAMRVILTPEARQRLATVELTREEVALGVKRHLVNLHNEGNLKVPVDDQTLKAVLSRLNSNRRDSTIRRI